MVDLLKFLDEAVEFAMALGPAGEIIRLAGEEGEKRKPEVVATLKETLGQINQLQAQADQKVAGLATGTSEDLPSTMIAVERANVAFQLMVEVRNKIVQAYQEVSQMSF